MKKMFMGFGRLVSVFVSLVVIGCLSLGKANAAADTTKALSLKMDTLRTMILDVKYVGKSLADLDFEVLYNNPTGNHFYFYIKDENGEVLYERGYDDKVFHKKIRMNYPSELHIINFCVSFEDGRKVYSKEIVVNTRMIEDVLVRIN